MTFLRKKLARFPTLALTGSTRTAVTVSLWSCESFSVDAVLLVFVFYAKSSLFRRNNPGTIRYKTDTCSRTDVYLFSSRSRTLTANLRTIDAGVNAAGKKKKNKKKTLSNADKRAAKLMIYTFASLIFKL